MRGEAERKAAVSHHKKLGRKQEMFKSLAVASVFVGFLFCAQQAVAQDADVMHWWTSGG